MLLIRPIPVKAPDTRLTEYIGTHDELIAQHVATLDMFPAGRKLKASGDGRSNNDHWDLVRIRGGQFRLRVWRSVVPVLTDNARTSRNDESDLRGDSLWLARGMVDALIRMDRGSRQQYDASSMREIRKHAYRLVTAIESGRIETAVTERPSADVVRLDQWR